MPRGPGQLIRLHTRSDGFKCLCCAPPPPNIIIKPGDDGT